jgi:hypothetical protein
MVDDARPRCTEYRKRGTLTRQACDSCFRSKRKCDGKKPCHQCLRNGQLDCDYKRPRRRMVSGRRRTDSQPTGTESFQLGTNLGGAKPSIYGSRQVPAPPATCDSTDTSNLLEGNYLTNGSTRDLEQADSEDLGTNRTVSQESDDILLPIPSSQLDLDPFYLDNSMMELDWLFGDSNGQAITPCNSSSIPWNYSQVSDLNNQRPSVESQASEQASPPTILEPTKLEKPSPMASHISNTPSWPTDYLSDVNDSDHNHLLASASPQDQALRYEHEQTPARPAQSRYSYLPQELGRIVIEGRVGELPKYLVTQLTTLMCDSRASNHLHLLTILSRTSSRILIGCTLSSTVQLS